MLKKDEILHAAMSRTVKQRRKETGTGKCGVSGVQDQKGGDTRKGASTPTTKNRARKDSQTWVILSLRELPLRSLREFLFAFFAIAPFR